MTMLMVETIWRTTAYILIYSELALKLAFVGFYALMNEATSMRWAIFIGSILLAPSLMHMMTAFLCIVGLKLVLEGSAGAKHWKTVLELTASLLSISLLLRSIPVIGTRIHLRKHHKLFRQSLMYRVMVHII